MREREKGGGGGSGVTRDELENELAGRSTLNQRRGSSLVSLARHESCVHRRAKRQTTADER